MDRDGRLALTASTCTSWANYHVIERYNATRSLYII